MGQEKTFIRCSFICGAHKNVNAFSLIIFLPSLLWTIWRRPRSGLLVRVLHPGCQNATAVSRHGFLHFHVKETKKQSVAPLGSVSLLSGPLFFFIKFSAHSEGQSYYTVSCVSSLSCRRCFGSTKVLRFMHSSRTNSGNGLLYYLLFLWPVGRIFHEPLSLKTLTESNHGLPRQLISRSSPSNCRWLPQLIDLGKT